MFSLAVKNTGSSGVLGPTLLGLAGIILAVALILTVNALDKRSRRERGEKHRKKHDDSRSR